MQTPFQSKILGSRSFTVRRSLIRNLVLLVLLTSGAILVATIRGANRAVHEVSRTLIEQTEDRVEAGLERFFQPVTTNLRIVRQWGRAGLLDLEDTVALNTLFMPIIEQHPQISSMLVADTLGNEYMLLRDRDGWRNRRTRVAEWGRRTQWLRWRDAATLLEKSWKELDYDPRRRPWYRQAMMHPNGAGPQWTAPYTFFTTKDPGITASIRWTSRRDSTTCYVVAFDLLLTDISRFTSGLDVSPEGMALVVTGEGLVIGLPGVGRFEEESAAKASVLVPVEELGIEALSDAVRRWKTSLRGATDPSELAPVRFERLNASWWGGFRPFPLGDDRLWIGVLVPESDFLGPVQDQRNQILWITGGALALAMLMAFALDRTYRRKIKHAVAHAQKLGQYTLEKKIGDGGMGSVYLARHAMLRRPTAIKLLRTKRAENEAAIARFEQEVQITSRLTHPNTIAVYDYGRTPENMFYYAMEFLNGVTLERFVPSVGPLPPGRAIYFLRQVCGSLGEAHAQSLIHRDIKPANIMVCERGGQHDVVKVLDFGLVKEVSTDDQTQLTRDHAIPGTPLYIAPEAISAPSEVGPRSDLYALGAVAYFLLTGHPVFEGKTVVEICGHHLNTVPTPPSQRIGRPLPEDLEAVVLACLEKDPNARPPSAHELERRLAACRDAGTWSAEDAHRWWESHGHLVPRTGGRAPASESPGTFTIDLARRSLRSEGG